MRPGLADADLRRFDPGDLRIDVAAAAALGIRLLELVVLLQRREVLLAALVVQAGRVLRLVGDAAPAILALDEAQELQHVVLRRQLDLADLPAGEHEGLAVLHLPRVELAQLLLERVLATEPVQVGVVVQPVHAEPAAGEHRLAVAAQGRVLAVVRLVEPAGLGQQVENLLVVGEVLAVALGLRGEDGLSVLADAQADRALPLPLPVAVVLVEVLLPRRACDELVTLAPVVPPEVPRVLVDAEPAARARQVEDALYPLVMPALPLVLRQLGQELGVAVAGGVQLAGAIEVLQRVLLVVLVGPHANALLPLRPVELAPRPRAPVWDQHVEVARLALGAGLVRSVLAALQERLGRRDRIVEQLEAQLADHHPPAGVTPFLHERRGFRVGLDEPGRHVLILRGRLLVVLVVVQLVRRLDGLPKRLGRVDLRILGRPCRKHTNHHGRKHNRRATSQRSRFTRHLSRLRYDGLSRAGPLHQEEPPPAATTYDKRPLEMFPFLPSRPGPSADLPVFSGVHRFNDDHGQQSFRERGVVRPALHDGPDKRLCLAHCAVSDARGRVGRGRPVQRLECAPVPMTAMRIMLRPRPARPSTARARHRGRGRTRRPWAT